MFRICLIMALIPLASGCRTFNAMAGFDSPTVPPPATGSYQIPGGAAPNKPYYSPATDGAGAAPAAPGGQWLPVQSSVAPNSTDPASVAASGEVRNVSYDEAAGSNAATPASTEDIANNIQQRLAAGRMAAADASGLLAPGTLVPSPNAQPLAGAPVNAAPPVATGAPVSPGTPATNPLSTPAFDLPTAGAPVGSGVSGAAVPVSGTAPTAASQPSSWGGQPGSALPGVPTSATPLPNQPTLVPSPLSVPAGGNSSGWTSSSSSTVPQPTPVPAGGTPTSSFRPRVLGGK